MVLFVKKILQSFILALILMTPFACASKITPQEVTRSFWQAVEQHKNQDLKNLISSAADFDDKRSFSVSDIQIGKVIIEGELASVETELVVLAEKPFRTTIKTHLIQIDGSWKVDYQKTIPALTQISAADKVLDNIKSLGKIFSDSVDKSIEDLKAQWPALKQQLEELEADAEATIPELRKKLDEIKKKFEQHIEDEPDQEKATPDSGRSV